MYTEALANTALDAELKHYGDPVVNGIKNVLGARADEALTPDEYPVVGYLLMADEDLFRSYFLTPRTLRIFEMNTGNTTLSIVIPVGRITRTEELREGETIKLTIELDADKLLTTTRGDFAYEQNLAEGAPLGQKVGRTHTVAEQVRGTYILAEVLDTDAGARLVSFARLVARAMER
jgi:hypothetical protein